MKHEHIANDPDFVDFCNRRKLKPNTVKQYLHALGIYTNLIDISLSEMIEEAEKEEDAGLRLRRRKVRKHLSKFQLFLEDLNYSENSKKTITSCVRAYYNECEIQLPKTFKKDSRSDRKEIFFEDLPTMEDIKHLLKYANLTYTAIILLGLSSGMSRAEICSLTFEDFYKAIQLDPYPETLDELLNRIGESTDIIPLWQIKRIKTDNQYFTYSSPESTEAIINYIEDLNRKNKKLIINKRKSQFKLSPKTPLFLSNNMTGMSETVMSIAYKRFNERAGFEKIDGKVFIRPHVLRKIFASTLEKNKMPHLMTRWMMGHTLDSTTSAYFKADPESIKEEYVQVLIHLTTNQKIVMKPVTTEGYDQLLKDSKEKTAQIESMKKKMEEMELKNKERDEFLDDLMTKRNVIKKVLEEVDKND